MAKNLRPFIDGKIPPSGSPTGLLQVGRADVEVRFIEMVGEGSARAYYPADTANEIVAPCEGGRYFVDAVCPAVSGADGRISRIFPPLEWPEGGDPLLVGDAEVDRARVQQLAQQAKDRAEAASDAFEEFVPEVEPGERILAGLLIAGPGDGYHTEMNQTGIKFRSKLAGVTEPQEVLRINTPGTDSEGIVFGLADPNDLTSLTASINVAGQASFADLVVPNLTELEDVTVAGDTLDSFVRARASRILTVDPVAGSALPANQTAAQWVAEVQWENPWDTIATVSFPPTVIPGYVYGNGILVGRWIATVDGSEPLSTGTIYAQGRERSNSTGDTQLVLPAWSIQVPVGGKLTARLRMFVHNGVANWTLSSDEQIQVSPDVTVGDVNTEGALMQYVGPSAPPPSTAKKTYTLLLKGTWLRSFWRGTGAYNSGMAGKAAQGSYSGGAGQAMKGAIGFPAFQSTLNASGVTITRVRARIQLAHTYVNAGIGGVGVGFHNAASAPASMSGGTALVTTPRITPGGFAWVNIPVTSALSTNLKNGNYKGLLLYTASNATSLYAYAATAANQYLEITYTK